MRPFPTRTASCGACSLPLRLTVVALVAAALALPGCGSSTPEGPDRPTGPGAITGRYTLELVPAPVCGGRRASFVVEVTQTASSPHPGAQLLLLATDPARLELEFKYVGNTLEGGIGTTGDGAASVEGAYVWVNAIASGSTTRTNDGRGEVVSGVMRGFLEIEGVTDACSAANHAFTLRVR